MQYFKHSELATQYHVSLKTVHNWISAAKEKKLDLMLHEAKSGLYVANTPGNIVTLEGLAEKGKKYRNSLHHKIVKPSKEFYEIFSRRQILDVINSIEIHREIPRQYNYFEEGAHNWDNWLKYLETEKTSNILKGSRELLLGSLDTFDRLLKDTDRVNVIDLGVGNAFPVRDLVNRLLETKKLNRYIAIDISKKMIDVAETNINKWFNGEVKFEGHLRDFSYERFDDLLIDDMLNDSSEKTINLVLMLGGTPGNFRSFTDIFKVIYGSVGAKDILVYTDKLDTESSRRYFNFSAVNTGSSIKPGMSKLSPSHRYILDLMNIDESYYKVEAGFDAKKYMRYIQIRLETSLTLEFKMGDTHHSIQLEKGDAILLLRVWHLSALQYITEFEKTGFMLLHSSLTNDRQYFLSISGVEVKPAKEI